MLLREARRLSRPQLIQILGRQYLLPTWYPAPLVTGLAIMDQGRRLVSAQAPSRAIPDLTHATIVVAKPDHFGDLIQATALLRALRDRLPSARLVLVHGSWAREVGEWLVAHDYVHSLVTYDAAWLQSGNASWPTRIRVEHDTRATASAQLRAMHADVYLDIRCTSPSTIDLAIASEAALRIGFGLRGRSWEYHALIPYRADASLGQNCCTRSTCWVCQPPHTADRFCRSTNGSRAMPRSSCNRVAAPPPKKRRSHSGPHYSRNSRVAHLSCWSAMCTIANASRRCAHWCHLIVCTTRWAPPASPIS